MPDPIAPAPAAAPAAPTSKSAAPVKPSAAPVKPNPVGAKVEAGAAPAAPKPESTAPPSRLSRKEKIDGKEVELFATEEELWASHRKASTLDRRFEEVSNHRKEIAAEKARNEQMYARLTSPDEILNVFMEANPDADPIEVMSAILQKRLNEEDQNQDPNVRERRRLERENADYRTREEKAKEAEQAAEFQTRVDSARGQLAETFTQALELTKLPRNDITLELMAKAEKSNRSQGWQLTPQQLAAATEKSVNGLIESVLTNESTTDDQLLDAFPELTKRVHRAIVARFKARGAARASQPSDVTPRERRATTEEAPKQRVVSSKEEYEAFGGKGLRTI